MPGVCSEPFGAPDFHHGFYQSHVKTALIPAEKPNPNNEVSITTPLQAGCRLEEGNANISGTRLDLPNIDHTMKSLVKERKIVFAV
jgi:hypothetical protein